MIIYLEGPNESRKTTMAKVLSGILEIPIWERSPYLPHHDQREFHNGNSWWYIEDELKTIEAFKKIGGNIIIDRHPLLSEKVFSKISGRTTPLYHKHFALDNDEILFLLYTKKNREYDEFELEIEKTGYIAFLIDTNNFEKATGEIIQTYYTIKNFGKPNAKGTF